MLPVRLELHNFLAYRTPDPILFEGIHLACLSGANGAGKSSILDSITWVLWGKARAKSDDDLVHIGQDEVSVTLDFMQGSDKYRVIRKRRLGKVRANGGRSPGQTTLDLLGWVEDENTFRVISEPSIRATQDRIVELVGLDHDTFVNSAYLQQGRADAFTKQTPAHRKQILTDILKLDLWQLYEERAKKKLRSIEDEQRTNDGIIATIDEEIAAEPALRVEHDRVTNEYQQAKEEAEAAEQRYQEMAGARQEESQALSEIARLNNEIRRYENELRDVMANVESQAAQLETFQGIIAERERIESGYAQLMEAQAANEALGDLLRQRQQMDETIRAIEEEINKARQEIIIEMTSSEARLSDSQEQTQHGEQLRDEIEGLREDLVKLERDEARRETLIAEISNFRADIAALKSENESLMAEMTKLRQVVDTLSLDTGEQTCPACGQPLDDERREHLVSTYESQGKGMAEVYRGNKETVEQYNAEIKQREGDIRLLDKLLKKINPLRSKIGSLEQRLKDIAEAEQRMDELQQRIDYLKDVLDKDDFAHELQRQLGEAIAERNTLNYSDSRHNEVREQLDTYREFQAESIRLQTALNSVEQLEKNLETAKARQVRFGEYLEDCQKQLTKLDAAMVDIKARVLEMEQREKYWHERRSLERNFYESMISIQQQLRSIEQQRERRKRLVERSEALQAEAGVFEQLRNAFSRNGVPAMVIESVIPELEEATNHLLRRMTEGRLVVRFDTQRERRSGGVIETFDILIADELGTRDYQLYSGGEAFRINFAIRVAVSQLLARRAGAQLRTLFIDEGFGTQDEMGRERLVEAITAIQNDFDLILVITHIDELRDAFPVRLSVEKLPSGSRVRIM